jgi:uncharacterized protein (TIGR03437 family)
VQGEKIMIRKWTLLAIAAGWATSFCRLGIAQDSPATILKIELENETAYVGDISDYNKLGTDPNPTTPLPSGDAMIRARSFSWVMVIADIVAVNGKPAKGTMLERAYVIRLTPNPTPGSTEAIADTTRFGMYDWNYEIQQADGTPVGSIRSGGVGQGPPPAGAEKVVNGANVAILGGTGAFLGARGYQGGTKGAVNNFRGASTSEAPANRRVNGGGHVSHTLYLIPMFRPEIVTDGSGPAVVHDSDFTLVTAEKPARSGEILTLFATGLGPTRPGLDPGMSFAADPPQVANSPIEVSINGAAAEVLYAGGYPGTTNVYQVNFRLPSGITPGAGSLQVTAAWVAGPEVRIAVR